MVEAMYIQFAILRKAMKLPAAAAPPRPADHPSSYRTFEYELPLQFTAAPSTTVVLHDCDLTTPPAASESPEKMPFHCSFCHGYKSWTKIQSFWSHIKNEHNDVPRSRRLDEIKRQTATYLDWVTERNGNYESTNERVWTMMQQTQLDTFDWETFAGWTLYADQRVKARRREAP